MSDTMRATGAGRPSSRHTSVSAMDAFLSLRGEGVGPNALPSQNQIDQVLAILAADPNAPVVPLPVPEPPDDPELTREQTHADRLAILSEIRSQLEASSQLTLGLADPSEPASPLPRVTPAEPATMPPSAADVPPAPPARPSARPSGSGTTPGDRQPANQTRPAAADDRPTGSLRDAGNAFKDRLQIPPDNHKDLSMPGNETRPAATTPAEPDLDDQSAGKPTVAVPTLEELLNEPLDLTGDLEDLVASLSPSLDQLPETTPGADEPLDLTGDLSEPLDLTLSEEELPAPDRNEPDADIPVSQDSAAPGPARSGSTPGPADRFAADLAAFIDTPGSEDDNIRELLPHTAMPVDEELDDDDLDESPAIPAEPVRPASLRPVLPHTAPLRTSSRSARPRIPAPPVETEEWKPADHPTVDPDAPVLPPDRYSDRELSWLAFNNRVLDLAKDKIRVPLLERAKFLAIFSSNMDEFFMVRVAGLKRRIDTGLAQRGTSGLLPRELHEAILSTARDLAADQAHVFTDEIMPELAEQGILLLRWSDLTAPEVARMSDLFRDRVFPILTPLAVDPSHPFPYISGLSLNLAVQLRNPQTRVRLFARIKVPNVLPRFIEVSDGRFIRLEEIIAHHLDAVFPGMEVLKYATFRVTRNEDVEVEEDDAENILFALEKELLRRKVGRPPVRLEVEQGIDHELLDILTEQLDVTTQEIFFIAGPLDLTGLFLLADADREDLKYPSFLPRTNPQLAEVETSQPADLFAALKKRDVLLHHPYDSFATSVQRFVEQAAADPQVLAIKQTLYRTSGDSPIVDALIEAARAGKQVLALVEIKARFDEQANIAWARKLEQSGVHVVYGVVGLKTHCKLSLVIRDEGDGLRRYCHIGTGNYNPKTARMYEDMGLLTSNPVITDDVARLFNHLSGMAVQTNYRRLLVSPFGIRNGLLDKIEHEIELQKSGIPGRIRIKVNSIVDEAIMDALYRASQAGVQVDLWVRGICALRGSVPGLSDNIRVRSILGRFLEHSRLFWFDNGGSPQVGIGSSDLMHRNLDRRVEVLVLLSNEAHIAEIDNLFNLAFADTTASWWLTEDGWTPRTLDANGNPLVDLQEHLIQATATRRATA